MINKRKVIPSLVSLLIGSAALSDPISPNIHNGERDYSKEKPNAAYYGSGFSGRMTEASELRFEGDQLMADGKLEEAKAKLGKAVMLDPGSPETHMMYARCITKILYSKKTVDEALLSRCLEEWSLLWHHNADQLEQGEAKAQCRALMRIAKGIEKHRKEKDKDKVREREESLASANKKTLE
jgi:hypothetical protein